MEEELKPEKFNLAEATRQVLLLKENVGKGIIALGQWLLLVRKNIKHGEWYNWLKYEVKLSTVFAWRAMKIAKTIDYPTLERLGPTKVYEILDLPADKFKEELLQLAPFIPKEKLMKIKALHKAGDPSSAKDLLEKVVPLTTNADTLLDANAALRDAIFRLSNKIDELPKHYLDLMANQLRATPQEVINFVQKLEYAIRKK